MHCRSIYGFTQSCGWHHSSLQNNQVSKCTLMIFTRLCVCSSVRDIVHTMHAMYHRNPIKKFLPSIKGENALLVHRYLQFPASDWLLMFIGGIWTKVEWTWLFIKQQSNLPGLQWALTLVGSKTLFKSRGPRCVVNSIIAKSNDGS